MCLHDLLPMCTLLIKLTRHFCFGVPSNVALAQHTLVNTHMHQSTIFEDNTGCLELSNKPSILPTDQAHWHQMASFSWCCQKWQCHGSEDWHNPSIGWGSSHKTFALSNYDDFSWVGSTFLIKNAPFSLFTTCFLFLHHGFLLHLSFSTPSWSQCMREP